MTPSFRSDGYILERCHEFSRHFERSFFTVQVFAGSYMHTGKHVLITKFERTLRDLFVPVHRFLLRMPGIQQKYG